MTTPTHNSIPSIIKRKTSNAFSETRKRRWRRAEFPNNLIQCIFNNFTSLFQHHSKPSPMLPPGIDEDSITWEVNGSKTSFVSSSTSDYESWGEESTGNFQFAGSWSEIIIFFPSIVIFQFFRFSFFPMKRKPTFQSLFLGKDVWTEHSERGGSETIDTEN